MRKVTIALAALTLILASCQTSTDTVTINGTWTLATVYSIPVSAIPGGASGTITVTNASTYTRSVTVTITLPDTGTVALKAGTTNVYTFTGSYATDFTLSDDGKTISGTDLVFGALTFTK